MRLILSVSLALAPLLLAKDSEPVNRLNEATAVFSEIMTAPDRGIPQDLLQNAHCVVIVPGLKTAAFVVGGKYGKGYVTCRNNNGKGWSAPGTVRIEGGSFGFQIGGQATDVVLLVMNKEGVNSLLKSKVKLGADASIAAGPKGRAAEANTDAYMRAEILSYSRSRGVFAGISLQGATLRPDNGADQSLYGKSLSAQQIVEGPDRPSTPPAAHELEAELEKASPQAA